MKNRHAYFLELLEYILLHFFDLNLDLSKSTEVILPKVRLDGMFEIPKEKLHLVPFSPLPVLTEVNCIEIKGYSDPLTESDLIQAIGELCIMKSNPKYQKKEVSMLILSTGKPIGILEDKRFGPFQQMEKWPWIYQMDFLLPLYIFVIDEMSLDEKEELAIFLPFQSPGKVKGYNVNCILKMASGHFAGGGEP